MTQNFKFDGSNFQMKWKLMAQNLTGGGHQIAHHGDVRRQRQRRGGVRTSRRTIMCQICGGGGGGGRKMWDPFSGPKCIPPPIFYPPSQNVISGTLAQRSRIFQKCASPLPILSPPALRAHYSTWGSSYKKRQRPLFWGRWSFSYERPQLGVFFRGTPTIRRVFFTKVKEGCRGFLRKIPTYRRGSS